MFVAGRTIRQIQKFNRFKLLFGLILLLLAVGSFVQTREDRVTASDADETADANLPTVAPTSDPTATAVLPTPQSVVLVDVPAPSTTITLDEQGPIILGQSRLVYGKAAPNVQLTLETTNGFLVADTVTDDDGVWQVEVDFDAIGAFSLIATAIMADQTAVRSSPLPVTVAVPPDTRVEPTIDSLSSAEYPVNTVVTLSGTGTPVSRFAVLINSEIFDVIETDLDGRWTYDAQFADKGLYRVRVQSLDAETRTQSPAIVFEVTDQPIRRATERASSEPTAIVTPTMRSSQPSGRFSGGTVDIDGIANPLYALEIVVNNDVAEWIQPSISGMWQHRLAFELPDTYTVYVRSVDDDGTIIANSSFVSLMLLDTATPESSDACAQYAPGEFLPERQYRVAPCETLSSIASRTGYSVEVLREYNVDVENPINLQPGQILNLPSR